MIKYFSFATAISAGQLLPKFFHPSGEHPCLADQFVIDSCATSREEIGNPPHRGTVNKLREMGIPVVPHQARQIPGPTIPILIISLVWILPTYAIFIVCSREIRIKKYPNY